MEPMQAELAHAITDYLKGQPATGYFPTEIVDLVIGRVEKPTSPNPRFSQPQICVNIQGAKQTMLEGRTFDYREMQFLVVSVDLPILGRVMQARPGRPFLGMILNIDMDLLSMVMEQAGDLAEPANSFSIGVGDVDAAMGDCLKRILDLLKHPKDIPVLYPLIARELYYRLLTGPHGGMLARLAKPDSHAKRIADVIRAMRSDIARGMSVEEMAAMARMSPSSFHAHFKTVTALAPLQYQKQLRLLAARHLMMNDAVSVTQAAFKVGYESPSQFSREYARMFGTPPKRDMGAMRGVLPLPA
jgi:AraC-like DNA-binding protein